MWRSSVLVGKSHKPDAKETSNDTISVRSGKSERDTIDNESEEGGSNIHYNCGHPSKEEFLRALRLSRARPEVLDYVRREVECLACAAKGHPPKPSLPAAMPRTFRVNETLGVDLLRLSLRVVPKLSSATWCVGARCTNCAFLYWTRLLRIWRSALLSDGSSILVDHCGPRKGVCGHSVQRIHERKQHPPSHN